MPCYTAQYVGKLPPSCRVQCCGLRRCVSFGVFVLSESRSSLARGAGSYLANCHTTTPSRAASSTVAATRAQGCCHKGTITGSASISSRSWQNPRYIIFLSFVRMFALKLGEHTEQLLPSIQLNLLHKPFLVVICLTKLGIVAPELLQADFAPLVQFVQ